MKKLFVKKSTSGLLAFVMLATAIFGIVPTQSVFASAPSAQLPAAFGANSSEVNSISSTPVRYTEEHSSFALASTSSQKCTISSTSMEAYNIWNKKIFQYTEQVSWCYNTSTKQVQVNWVNVTPAVYMPGWKFVKTQSQKINYGANKIYFQAYAQGYFQSTALGMSVKGVGLSLNYNLYPTITITGYWYGSQGFTRSGLPGY
jgi:hypothetical protein